MPNIIWKKPDNSIAVTTLLNEAIDPVEHANDLKNRIDVYTDWEMVATNYESFPDWVQNDWRFENGSVVVDLELAKETTRNRLRIEREPLLSALDVEYLRNQELGKDNTLVIAEKNRLRDITLLVDDCNTIEDLKALHC